MDAHFTTSNNPYLAPQAAIGKVSSPGEIELANRLTRLGASILDGLIQLVVIIPIFAILASFTIGFDLEAINIFIAGNLLLWTVLVLVVSITVFLAINFRLLRNNGQTVGKRICNIKIVRSDGSPADVQRIVIFRYLPIWIVSQIPVIGNVLVLVDPLFIFRESRKCLHDDIADTIVIKA